MTIGPAARIAPFAVVLVLSGLAGLAEARRAGREPVAAPAFATCSTAACVRRNEGPVRAPVRAPSRRFKHRGGAR